MRLRRKYIMKAKKETGSDTMDTLKLTLKIMGGIVMLILIIGIIFGGYFIVPAGHKGVVFNSFTGINAITYGEGFHYKLPFFEDVTNFEVRTRVYNEDASAASKDLQIVSTKVALNYHLDKEQVM